MIFSILETKRNLFRTLCSTFCLQHLHLALSLGAFEFLDVIFTCPQTEQVAVLSSIFIFSNVCLMYRIYEKKTTFPKEKSLLFRGGYFLIFTIDWCNICSCSWSSRYIFILIIFFDRSQLKVSSKAIFSSNICLKTSPDLLRILCSKSFSPLFS